MTMLLRNRKFVQGIAFGGLFGLLIGSLVAFQVGPDRVDDARHSMIRWMRRDHTPVNYSKLFV